MAWQNDLVSLVRYIINDYTSPYENTDSNLQNLIVVAAQLTKKDVDFDYDYSISISTTGISPDPFAVNDDAFVNLVALKAACLFSKGEQKNRARMGIAMRDGPASIDGRTGAEATAKWSDTICEDYNKAELEFRMGSRTPGAAIISPYRHDNSPYGVPTNTRYSNGSDYLT